MIAADVLDKLKGYSISRRDRELIYVSLIVNGLVTLLLLGAIFALVLKGKEPAALKDIATNLIWAEFALVVVFVAGSTEQRRQAVKAITAKPPEAAP